MITFQFFFLNNLLTQVGWPRSKGIIFKKQVVNKIVLRSSVNELVQMGVVLGAVNPKTAIRLFAEAFRGRDFSKQPPNDLLHFFNKYSDLEPDKLAEPIWCHINEWIFPPTMPDTIPWEIMLAEVFQVGYNSNFVSGLSYGLNHPEKAINAYERYISDNKSYIPVMLKAGLDIDVNQATQPIYAYEEMCLEVVKDFEKNIHPLASPSRELLEFPVFAKRLA